ncbi:hypothetical protein [Streptacidiphilus sp. PAMC 29251]
MSHAVGATLIGLWMIVLVMAVLGVRRAWRLPSKPPRPAGPPGGQLLQHARANRRAILPLAVSYWSMTSVVLCDTYRTRTSGWLRALCDVGYVLSGGLLLVSLVLTGTVVRLNRPGFLVPPALRDQDGLPWEGFGYWFQPWRWFDRG